MNTLCKVRCIKASNINQAKLLSRVNDENVIEMPDNFEDYFKLIRNLPFSLPNHSEIKTISDLENENFRQTIHLQYRTAFYRMVYGLSDVNQWQTLSKIDFAEAHSKKRYRKVEVCTWKEQA